MADEKIPPFDWTAPHTAAQVQERLKAWQEANARKWMGLMTTGGPAVVMGAQVDLLNLRVFTLARAIWGDDSPELAQFQVIFEEQTAELLDETLAAVRQAQMAAPVVPPGFRPSGNGSGKLLGPNGRPL